MLLPASHSAAAAVKGACQVVERIQMQGGASRPRVGLAGRRKMASAFSI